jgi:hypothetical protein
MMSNAALQMNAVPTFAPSVTASAGRRSRRPPAASCCHQAGRRADLQDHGDPGPGEKGADAIMFLMPIYLLDPATSFYSRCRR